MESFTVFILNITVGAVCLMFSGYIHTVFVSYVSIKFGGTGINVIETSSGRETAQVYFNYRVWLLALVGSFLFYSFHQVYLS